MEYLTEIDNPDNSKLTRLILNLGCECQTIFITLENGALAQSSRQGIYQRAGKVNGKTSWISSSNNNALWYNAAAVDWMIGSLDNLGANNGGISSIGNHGISSCPYNVPQNAWQYAANGAFIIAEATDVSIECLTGKMNSLYQICSKMLHGTKVIIYI